MANEIAVYTGIDGETAAISLPGNIVVYSNRLGNWKVERQLAFHLKRDQGLKIMREQISKLIDYLGECKVFIASMITGVPYYELEKAGVSVWEFEGKPQDFLDYILEKEEAEQQTVQSPPLVIPVPEHLGDGFYRISIKEIQETDSSVTSKQVLASFLRQANYYQLEVLCNHVPRWLETEAMLGSLNYLCEKIAPGEIRLTLRKQLCAEQ